MKHTYKIAGMTCNNCKASVEKYLSKIDHVSEVSVNLEKGEAEVKMNKHISTDILQKALPEKYTLSEKKEKNVFASSSMSAMPMEEEKSKLQQLKPLLLIIFYIATASVLLHYKNWTWSAFMLDFMGLFYIVFSFFKMLDLKGFPESFRMYDPLAKRVPFYGKVYPFIETALGLMFLLRFEINIALIITLIVLGITTIGVTKTLLDKKSIRCACLGTALKLPMTEATFIENAIMIGRSVIDHFTNGTVDEIHVVYNYFVNVAQQEIKSETLLPLAYDSIEDKVVDRLYEPSKESIVNTLIPRHLNVQMWKYLLESYASEQAARMLSMENATSNAQDMIKDLTLQFNKARQAAITTEMLEIVGGAEALG